MNILQSLNIIFPIHIILSILMGILIGYLHFWTLRWNVSLFLKPGNMVYAITIQIIRIAIATNVLFICIRLNMSLLAVMIGFLLARWIMMYQRNKA